MSRHAKPIVSAFVLALTATILASSAAQAFGPRPPARPRPSGGALPVFVAAADVDGNATPGLGLQAPKQGRNAHHKTSGRITGLAVDPADPNSDGAPLTFTSDPRSKGLSQPKLGLQTGGIHLPAMTARVPTITVRGSR